MKKYLSIAFAAVALSLASVSCVDERELAVFDPAGVTAQTLGEINGAPLSAEGPDITTTFNKADFKLSAPSGYTLYAAASGTAMAEKTKVTATIGDGTITMTQKDLNNLVLNMGAVAEEEFTVDFMLEGYLLSDKNTAIAGSQVSSNIVSATFIPYAANRLDVDIYEHVWVIGASPKVSAWDHKKVYQFLYDYNKDGVTYTGVIDFGDGDKTAADGWKITGTDAWVDDVNWGSEAQAEEAEANEIQLVAGGGSKDIKAYSKRFYSFKFNKSTLVLTKVAGWDKLSIVGSFNGWDPANEDCVMEYNDSYHRFWIDYTFAEDSELKFNADGAWDLNWGVDCNTGGDNIPVPAGAYRVYLDLNTNSYTFNAGMFGKEEPTNTPGGSEEPEVPEKYQGWGIIGDFNNWEADAAMTEENGVWTGYVNLKSTDGWKLRKDADWVENRGGVLVALGEPFAAVAEGANIQVPADGFYKVVYDSNAETITVSNGSVWSLIGDFNSWSGDIDMVEADGVWTASDVALTGGWKIRYNHAWDDDRGGSFEAFGQPFAVAKGGANINCGDGKFTITYNPADETITVVNAAKSWGVIGNFNNWAGDEKMSEVAPGIWVSDNVIELTEGWKVRFGADWEVNFGAATPAAQGEFVEAVPGGDNVNLAGSYKVVLNTNNNTLGTLGYALVGSIASLGFNWDKDLPMNLGKDGKWYSSPVALGENDEFKVRFNAGWDVNVGGECVEAETEFDAVAGGSNIKAPEAGTYMVVYDPENQTLTLTKEFWGMIGDFNSWGSDTYLMYDGDGNWVIYRQTIDGGWKLRKSSGWDVNRGGTFVESGVAFDVENNGSNISVGDGATFSVVYTPADEKITVTVLK